MKLIKIPTGKWLNVLIACNLLLFGSHPDSIAQQKETKILRHVQVQLPGQQSAYINLNHDHLYQLKYETERTG